MNLMVYKLSGKVISAKPQRCPRKLTVDDNIGESIHLHYRNLRFEYTVKEFLKLSEGIIYAKNKLDELKKIKPKNKE